MTITLTKDELQAVLAGQQASICKIAELQDTITELVKQVDDLSFRMELSHADKSISSVLAS